MRWPLSDHYDGRHFFNPGLHLDHSFAELRRWRRSARPVPWPRAVENPPFPPPPPQIGAGEAGVTFIGHATFLIRLAGLTLLTDPIFSDRASPVSWAGPRRVRPPALALAALPKIDIVLLSHNHYDHMDLPSLRRLRAKDDPLIVTGLGNARYLARKGLANTQKLDWWQSTAPRAGYSITFVPAQHWSKRGFFDRRKTLWGGHIVEAPGIRLYFAGDTGYPAQFAEIKRRLGPPDIALLPIGAYEPRWFMGPQHMDPEEAVRAHLDLGATTSLALHFATFPLTDEAIDAPALALNEARQRHGVAPEAFLIPGFGETIRRQGRRG